VTSSRPHEPAVADCGCTGEPGKRAPECIGVSAGIGATKLVLRESLYAGEPIEAGVKAQDLPILPHSHQRNVDCVSCLEAVTTEDDPFDPLDLFEADGKMSSTISTTASKVGWIASGREIAVYR
jgi:hypothetical protein